VPSFAVQHLVENAVRHGIARRTEVGLVTVRARREVDALIVTVTDDGPGIAGGMVAPRGHGLENTRERLQTLYPAGGASLELSPGPERGTVARLTIPYREIVLEPERNGQQ
jgi:LytS/YehU family sensor histidine kinase